MSKFILSAVVLFATSLSFSTAIAQTLNHDPETEQDYGPGFWDADPNLGVDRSQHVEPDLIGDEDNIRTYQEEVIQRDGFHSFMQNFLSFPQIQWNECKGNPTANYLEFACSPSRTISVILNKYLQETLMSCVDEGMRAQGGGTAAALHITHAGITADARHSPHSLHSKNRAIDIKALAVQLTNGETRQFTYAKVGNRPFYTGLRKCWGKKINTGNGCPLYSGNPALTGSIGWENTQHGHHMHLSVPYCINGRYGPGLWKK